MASAWKKNFNKGSWQTSVDVRDFIVTNYTYYSGDDNFLVGPTKATKDLWDQVKTLFDIENKKKVFWM